MHDSDYFANSLETNNFKIPKSPTSEECMPAKNCKLLTVFVVLTSSHSLFSQKITGELQRWHKTTVTIDGPQAEEEGEPNPFLDYRMQVTFTHPESGLTYCVPGYFAADGDAANSGANSGNKWRAHLCPDHIGKWEYRISFRTGDGVAVSDDAKSGTAVKPFDGMSGTFEITETDKTGRDFRSKGRLKYVGKHHLQFAGSKEFFLKAGVDAPENLLAYRDFDGNFKTDGIKDALIKDWTPHEQDWREGDPTWQGSKGKGLIGAVNYLADQGLNAFSFLTLNIDGDDRNVFPYTDYKERVRIDCSRMDQWEIVFAHGTQLGMHLHFKTQECENVNLLDGGETGPQRKLYYRELIARFSHHLAMNWNLGEEVGYINPVSTEKKVAWANYFAKHDPYHHPIVIHNGNKHYDMLGDASPLTGFSLQTNRADFGNVHGATLDYIRRSVKAGKPWVVACDEPGDAQHSLIPDKEDPTRDDARQNALWGNLMAGGAGIEWYFGYKHEHSDLTCQDYRVRQSMWEQSSIALKFFEENAIPFWQMSNANELVKGQQAFCLRGPQAMYLVFSKDASQTKLDLSEAKGVFEIKWFDPRKGGSVRTGTAQAVVAGTKVDLGQPPADTDRDWLAVICPGDPNRDYPPGVNAGENESVMFARSAKSVSANLSGTVTDDGKGKSTVSSKWSLVNGPGEARIENSESLTTSVILDKPGTYVFQLSANDGSQESQATTTVTVEPFQSRETRSLKAIDNAYAEGKKVFSNQYLKLENKRRTSVVKFSVKDLPPNVLDVELKLHQNGDGGGGTIQVFRVKNTGWKGDELTFDTFPVKGELLGEFDVQASGGETVSLSLPNLLQGDGDYAVLLAMKSGGDDVWFGSMSSGNGPELAITFEDPDGKYDAFGQVSADAAIECVLSAIEDFAFAELGDFVIGYKDMARKALAINAAKYRDRFAAAESKYAGPSDEFDIVLTTLTETDGESSYRVLVGDKLIGEVQNPPSSTDYQAVPHRFKKVKLQTGDTIRVEFNSASNGKIPEGDAFAFSRGRWKSLAVLKPDANWSSASENPKSSLSETKGFVFNYDPEQAKRVHVQTDGILVVEAEDFDAVNLETHRKWYRTSVEQGPGVKPDPDPNHATDASGGAYLEILPDTRVTHADPLVNGVSFSNQPGQCSVLYYPVEIKTPGRYYVWVRMCCTGSEDNGLHVGIDGKWPKSGARLQFTGQHGKWQWDSRQRTESVHTGVLGQIWLDIDKPGLHTVMFSMREDGFEFDKFMLTREKSAMKTKSLELGPKPSPTL